MKKGKIKIKKKNSAKDLTSEYQFHKGITEKMERRK